MVLDELINIRQKLLKSIKENDTRQMMWNINDLDTFIFKYKKELNKLNQKKK